MATPTVSVTAGQTAVAGKDTAFIAFPDDLLTVAGFSVPIAAASATNITLKYPWPGPTLIDTPNWTLSNTAAAWNPGTQTYLRVNELLDRIAAGLPFSPDANGPLAGRSAYNNQPANFIYLATDGGAWTIYIKQSAANADTSWSPGFVPRGSQGQQGNVGAPGTPGATGATGPANTLKIGTVSGGATAGVTITGSAPNQVLNLVLPKGDTGSKGDTGLTGPANTLSVGTVTTAAAGSNATISITGSAPNQVVNFTIPRGNTGAQGLKGDQGDQGFTGAPGPANVISLGTVATGSPGSNVAVAINGTSPNQTISFVIPRGDVGAKGDQGIQGLTGQTGPANTITMGTVSTGAPGSTASASVTGTAPNQVLNLVVPRGDRGASGIDGRPAEFRGNNTAEVIEWRLVGDTAWQTLVTYAAIQSAAAAMTIGDVQGLQAALDALSAQITNADDPFITALIFGS